MKLAVNLRNRLIARVLKSYGTISRRGLPLRYLDVEHDGVQETWLAHDVRRRFVATPSKRLVRILLRKSRLKFDPSGQPFNRSSRLMSWPQPLNLNSSASAKTGDTQ